ncbi:MAG: bifunctional glutamate N-acetyltransferase/amino-acid acetyltransferase ArgJ [Lachnospiraceae bacterium]|nr:bifunctional glutamate N-acetyltransferase/amino-acid acetyltransferase ArgJ [Lachnospiraceae bacterium]
MKVIDSGVTAAKGYKAAGVAAGIKYTNRKDMAMILSESPATVAGMFTSNVVKAAPVKYDMDIVANSPYVHAVVVNSGIANAATGEPGMNICRVTAQAASDALSIPANSVLVGSTGVIGEQIPTDKIKAGVEALAKSLSDTRQAAADAESAIMTTDTVPKEIAVQVMIGGKCVTIGGMSKGSGMIHPNMCTMLAYICTDCAITKERLSAAVHADIPDTFNMITVDGDTSTNDTYLVLANGCAENPVIDCEGDDFDTFLAALHYVDEYLAKHMAKDGEGANALFEVKVTNADTKENAKLLARSVASSSLCKAAIFGHDSNFGRFLCALGYSGADFDPDKVSLDYVSRAGSIRVFENGLKAAYSEDEATKILSEDEITVVVDMNAGSCEATAWGCDLTFDYVKINADYRS